MASAKTGVTRHVSLLMLAMLGLAPGCSEDVETVYLGRTAQQWGQRIKDDNPDVRAEAIGALAELHDEGVPILVETLAHDDKRTRVLAQEALERIGNVAIPELGRALDHHDLALRINAAVTLASLVGPEHSSLVQPLVTALHSENPNLKRAAAESLGKIGTKAELAIPRLIEEAVKPNDQYQQKMVFVEALVSIGTPTVRFLVKTLSDSTRVTFACGVLNRIGAPAEPAVPNLLRLLDGGNPEFHSAAIHAFTGIGPAAAPAVPRLIACLGTDHSIRAARCLEAIGRAAAEAIPRLRVVADSLTTLPDPSTSAIAARVVVRKALRSIEETQR